jgi:NAD(P)-dependent dehydrogenase (short-subunit alcohol dehydrogenase family)
MSGAAVVTGAGSGLGRAVARQLANDGVEVALVDLDGDALAASVSEIEGGGGQVRSFITDVSDWDSVARTAQRVIDEIGPPRALVNAAAIQRFGHAHELEPRDWQRVLDVNLTGTFFMCRALLPVFVAGGGGAIVNIASTAGLTGMPYDVAYCAAKGGVIQLTKALAVEYSQQHVRVNAVAPGGMQTPMLHVPPPADASPELQKRLRRSLIGVAAPDDVANVVCFLLSDQARYMTGSIVVADGGALA